ncbi:hypothetical protein M5D96_011528 [Drosophila gunungcola]|uniref:Uncharacterized protein n=1 Tax=Drosophila gunungcola TaxID=103775 RepID=A0A9Q0BKF4_9MUSC|nr:hypothetical protein M5D96_011528 [Drosophila gunungcola]
MGFQPAAGKLLALGHLTPKEKTTHKTPQIPITTNTTQTREHTDCNSNSNSDSHSTVDITTDTECQHRGGTCEFFLGCWLSGGLIQGTCDGLLRGCCHRTAKSANLGSSDFVGNAVDLTDLPQKNYGPVNNEPSECGSLSSV